MSLRPIVQALGGDLYDRGLRANIPAPGHSAADRSVSLLLREGRVIVHTFGDGDWKDVLDYLRGEGLVDAHNAPTSLSQSRRARPPARRRDWNAARPPCGSREAGRPLGGTLSARHCAQRSVSRPLPGPDVLRHGGRTRRSRPTPRRAITVRPCWRQ